jgi:hypothetical protein
VASKKDKKDEVKLTSDGIYTMDPDYMMSEIYSGAHSEMLEVGPITHSDMFDEGYYGPGTPDMFDVYEERELRAKFPSLQRAWENYKILVQLCRSELEKNEN